jgi:hypothetical protein
VFGDGSVLAPTSRPLPLPAGRFPGMRKSLLYVR